MTCRCSLVLLAAMTTGALASVPTEIHSQTTAGETSPPSRTAWGDPDLHGGLGLPHDYAHGATDRARRERRSH